MTEFIDTDTLNYTNISFINNANIPQEAQVKQIRTSTILDVPSEWVMSVVRFDIDSNTLPINLPLMQTGSTQNTQSVITLRYLGVNYSQVVTYDNSAIDTQIYKFPVIYNYEEWLRRVNLAASFAFSSIGIAGNAPQFIYDAKTGLIDLFVDEKYIEAAGANKITIFMNQQLFSYFINFPYDYQVINITDPLLQYRLKITNENTLVQPAVGSRQGLPISVQPIVNLYLITDSAPSTGNWTSVRSVILTSTTLPFRPETIPAIFDPLSSGTLFPILSDFLIPVEDKVTDSRIVNQYLPTAQYRYIDLASTTPLTSIDLQFYWTDFANNIYKLYLLPQTSFNVKILFQKRNSLISK